MPDNLQIAIWLEYAEKAIDRAAKNAKNPAIKRIYLQELGELTKHINDLKAHLTPTPIEAEIKKKGG